MTIEEPWPDATLAGGKSLGFRGFIMQLDSAGSSMAIYEYLQI